MKKLVFLGLAAFLAACTPAAPALPTPPPNPRRSPSPVVTASATPSPSPSPFTQELSAEQQAAIDAVKEYFRVLDLVQSNPDEDIAQLTLLYFNNQLASTDAQATLADRRAGVVLTGQWGYHYQSVGEPVDAGGMRSIEVTLCIDGTQADFVDAEGNSTLSPDRPMFQTMSIDMVDTEFGWLLNAFTSKEVEKC